MIRTLIFFLISTTCIPTHGQIDLDKILSAPHSSDLVKSKNGTCIAWVTNTKGVRTIESYNIKTDTLITHFTTGTDDGQVLGGLTFDDVGEWLYFLKGSGPNRRGHSANPTSSGVYPSRILIRVNTQNSIKDTIGQFSNFIVAPGLDYLLLSKGSQLFRFDLETKSQQEILKMRGSFAGIQFAPDGQSICFVSQRDDHSFIGHFTFGTDHIQWLSPGVDLDTEPHFSPDGNQVAFLRLPGHKKDYLNDITSGIPFSIMVYHFDTQSLDTIWTSPNDAGGFAQYYFQHPLRWTQSNKLLFYSEHEGFMKVYAINPDGSDLESMIDGPCEVEHSDVNVAGDRVVFSSNCGDIDRRDIAIFDLLKHEIQPITTTKAIETYPQLLEDNRIAYLKGSANEPTAVFIDPDQEKRLSLQVEDDFPSGKFVVPQQIIFQAADGLSIHGQLFDNGLGNQKPAIIFMHGGPIRQMLLGYHYSGYYANTYAFNQYLASNGYTVMSVNFRSGIGYGRDFRRAPGQGPRGASEYQDIVAAAKYLQSLAQVDPSRIGLWGGSYGGYLTAMGLARNSDIFRAGVDLHGVHDWAWRAEDFSEGGSWGINDDLMADAYASSPVASVQSWTSPVLFVHGDDDRNVMFGQTVDLVQRLRARNVYHEILVLPDEVHGFYRWESWYKTFNAASSFFDRMLKE